MHILAPLGVCQPFSFDECVSGSASCVSLNTLCDHRGMITLRTNFSWDEGSSGIAGPSVGS